MGALLTKDDPQAAEKVRMFFQTALANRNAQAIADVVDTIAGCDIKPDELRMRSDHPLLDTVQQAFADRRISVRLVLT